MSKQTAVDWLKHELNRRQSIIDSEPDGLVKETMRDNLFVDLFEQAKAMEKENIVEAYDAGLFDGTMDEAKDRIYTKYYNQTYGGTND